MKLLIYTHVWKPVLGGVQTVTADLAEGFTAWGSTHPGENVDVTIATETPAGNMNDAALPFSVVRQPGWRKLVVLLRQADVIHIANPALKPLLLARWLRKPTVIEHDGYQAACPNGLFLFQPDRTVCPGHFLARRYEKCVQCNSGEMGALKSFTRVALTFPRRWLAQRVAVNIAPTAHVGRRVALPNTRVIHHGVPRYFHPTAHAAEKNGKSPYFAYVGRLVIEKGLPVLLNACAQLAAEDRDFRMKIIGDGTERANLENTVRTLDLDSRVEFLGAFPVGEVQGFLGDAEAVIMPSIWEDVAPLAAYEQLMHGQLVIASDIGGLGEIVEGVSLKFPVGNSHALAACMRRVLNEPEMARDLKARAQKRALEAFTQERMIADHLAIYRELIHRAGRGQN